MVFRSGWRLTAAAALFLVFLIVNGCTERKPSDPITRKANTVTSVSVSKGPRVDGSGSDAVWRSAPEVIIPTSGGPPVAMRSVHTGDMIYTLFSWPDATKGDVDETWEFDGAKWRMGEIDDAFAVFWDIDGSVPGFADKGCEAVCHRQGTDPAAWGMWLSGAPDAKGDIWDISLGISNIRGSVNDYVFDVDPALAKNPAFRELKTIRRQDTFTERAPMILNYTVDPADGSKKPSYRLKDGLTAENTPYPFIDQVEPITDYTAFKAGDRIPYIIFYPFTARWGGSRDDIWGKGVWKEGRWTVEMKRRLATGHTDDVRFAPGKRYTFAVAVFDHTIIGHYPSKPVYFEVKSAK